MANGIVSDVNRFSLICSRENNAVSLTYDQNGKSVQLTISDVNRNGKLDETDQVRCNNRTLTKDEVRRFIAKLNAQNKRAINNLFQSAPGECTWKGTKVREEGGSGGEANFIPRIPFSRACPLIGLRLSISGEYVSNWTKNSGYTQGARGVIDTSLVWAFLPGTAADLIVGSGFGAILTKNQDGKKSAKQQFTPHAGLGIRSMTKNNRKFPNVALHAGYQASITENEDEKYDTQHGGYVRAGIGWSLPPRAARVTDWSIYASYAGYHRQNTLPRKHEFTAGINANF